MSRAAVHLHGFFRSSASWRVRIALHLKGVSYTQTSYMLRLGQQRAPDYLALNPQGLVPALEIDGHILTQSLAIIEYLDETRPDPRLLPDGPLDRAHVRAVAQAIACDVHPVQNLRVLQKVQGIAGERASSEWATAVNADGLDAVAAIVSEDGPFCCGEHLSMADLALVPQMANARRFGVAVRSPRLKEIEQACLALPAFQETAPDRQPDFAA